MRLTRNEMLWIPLVLAALLAIYLPGLGNDLVFDDGYLADGELFRDYATILPLKVRALSYGSFVWLARLWGEAWWPQRLFNLAIHCGVVLALWALYREILRRIEPAPGEAPVAYEKSPALGFAIGFVAINPVAVYAAAYLVQRSILMATLFTVLALWLFMRALTEHKPLLHGAALACYVFAVASKEHAVLAPLAAIPLYVLAVRPSPRRLAVLGVAGAALVAAAGAVLALRYGDIFGKPFDEYSRVYLAQLAQLQPGADRHAFALSIENQAWLFFHYGLRWLVPLGEWMSINLRPVFPVTFGTFPQVLGPVAYLGLIAGASYLLLRFRDWRALLGVSLLMPALLFGTEFATVWVQDPFVLYRSYLWAIGMPGLLFFVGHGLGGRGLIIASVILGPLLVIQSLDRVFSLGTAERAWTDAIDKLPRDPRAVGRWFPYLNRGAEYVEQNRFNLALRDFEASSALGDLGMGAFNAGAVLQTQGRHAQALQAFETAEKQGYRLYNLPFERGLALMALGRAADAYREFSRALELGAPSPTRELALANLGRLAMQLGKPAEAVASLDRLLALDPANRDGMFLLGMAHVMGKQPDRALPVFERLLASERSGRAYYGRALAHYGQGHKREALEDIDQAIRIGPDSPHLHEWRARIEAMK